MIPYPILKIKYKTVIYSTMMQTKTFPAVSKTCFIVLLGIVEYVWIPHWVTHGKDTFPN